MRVWARRAVPVGIALWAWASCGRARWRRWWIRLVGPSPTEVADWQAEMYRAGQAYVDALGGPDKGFPGGG